MCLKPYFSLDILFFCHTSSMLQFCIRLELAPVRLLYLENSGSASQLTTNIRVLSSYQSTVIAPCFSRIHTCQNRDILLCSTKDGNKSSIYTIKQYKISPWFFLCIHFNKQLQNNLRSFCLLKSTPSYLEVAVRFSYFYCLARRRLIWELCSAALAQKLQKPPSTCYSPLTIYAHPALMKP